MQFFNFEKAKYIERRKFSRVLSSLYLQYVQKLAVEVTRLMLLVCTKLGYKEKDFSLRDFFVFSDGLVNAKSEPLIKKYRKYKAFDMLFKITNFLKHNSIDAYLTLKKRYPNNIHKDAPTRYENGMYAGDFIYLQPDYMNKIFDKLLIFFGEWCSKVLAEDVGDRMPEIFD